MSSIYAKLINFILTHEGENWFTSREFAEKYHLNWHSVRKYLNELALAGYLEKMKQGKFTYYRLKNPHRLAEYEREIAKSEMLEVYRQQIEELTQKLRETRRKLAEYEKLLAETPDEPVVPSEVKKVDYAKLITELLYQKWCTKNFMRIKHKPEPEI